MTKAITQHLHVDDITPYTHDRTDDTHVFLATCTNDLGSVTETVLFGGETIENTCLMGVEGACNRDKCNCPFADFGLYPDEKPPYSSFS